MIKAFFDLSLRRKKVQLMYYDKICHRHTQMLTATELTPAEFDVLLITKLFKLF